MTTLNAHSLENTRKSKHFGPYRATKLVSILNLVLYNRVAQLSGNIAQYLYVRRRQRPI